ncbi:hypothetical protein DAMNIGENAA_26840 [Desulforhabdus amnigena]|uniref:Uncharacterized protein n=1 Tax=Desulforhabdus amnigena TaxID=40218 RepID=A0A9W6L9P2_9BACT|nr:hypothetical protein DAMNIGENAA_26840 [Desulforhabdus amnigena]
MPDIFGELRVLRAYPKTYLGSGHPPLIPPSRGELKGGVAKSTGGFWIGSYSRSGVLPE